MALQSLSFRRSPLASPVNQLEVLEHGAAIPAFGEKLLESGVGPLKPRILDILQINVGKVCNQACHHCHVDAGPDRREIMSRTTMSQCLEALRQINVTTVDITGGAPEMNPDFRWFVQSLRAMGKRVIVRCNLTIIVANKKYHDLPEFYRDNQVEVISSLPFYSAERTDRQRGEGVFENSIAALKILNKVGYGKPGSGLILNLVYNPAGAFLSPDQQQMERDFKYALKRNFDLDFNNLYCITNLPISRYLDYLVKSGNFENYMERLVLAFNPKAAENVMCRDTLSVGWDGFLYDCDFNQMLEMKVSGQVNHISNFDHQALMERQIKVNQHCYGCTAGAGSSCSGATAGV